MNFTPPLSRRYHTLQLLSPSLRGAANGHTSSPEFRNSLPRPIRKQMEALFRLERSDDVLVQSSQVKGTTSGLRHQQPIEWIPVEEAHVVKPADIPIVNRQLRARKRLHRLLQLVQREVETRAMLLPLDLNFQCSRVANEARLGPSIALKSLRGKRCGSIANQIITCVSRAAKGRSS